MGSRLRLQGVTLLTVTSTDIDRTHAILVHCAQNIEFGAVKMLCSRLPVTTDPGVQYIRIAPIDFYGYSRLMIESLNSYVQTNHCLIVQADGFVLDPNRWREQFLEYDYIGAPWAEYVRVSGIPGMQRLILDWTRTEWATVG